MARTQRNKEIIGLRKIFGRPNIPTRHIAFGRMAQSVDGNTSPIEISANSDLERLIAHEKLCAEVSANAFLKVGQSSHCLSSSRFHRLRMVLENLTR
jgi:hypothetical protein